MLVGLGKHDSMSGFATAAVTDVPVEMRQVSVRVERSWGICGWVGFSWAQCCLC